LPADWLAGWNLDPVLIALVAAGTAWSFVRGGRERNWQLAAIGLFALLYLTPLCTLPSALFSARVVHHIVLATVLAPLFVRALRLERFALPGSLAVLTAVQALVFWAWHAPPLYAAALRSDALFWLMQVSITASAAIWWARLRQAPASAAVLSLLATMVQMGLLGALLTFAGRALYAPHWLTTQAWGFSPLEDQQVAGLVMWAPASGLYLMAALVTLYRSMPAHQAART
jgi:putative membrane protein